MLNQWKTIKLSKFRDPSKYDNQGIPEITFQQLSFHETRFYTVGVPPETEKTPTFYLIYLRRAPNSSSRKHFQILGGSLLFCRGCYKCVRRVLQTDFLSPPPLLHRFQSSDQFWKAEGTGYVLKQLSSQSAKIRCLSGLHFECMLFRAFGGVGLNEPVMQCCE